MTNFKWTYDKQRIFFLKLEKNKIIHCSESNENFKWTYDKQWIFIVVKVTLLNIIQVFKL